MSIRKRRFAPPPIEQVAGNGLLDRRALLRGGAMVAGAMTTGVAVNSAAAEPLQNDPWSLENGHARCRPIRWRRGTRRTWCAR